MKVTDSVEVTLRYRKSEDRWIARMTLWGVHEGVYGSRWCLEMPLTDDCAEVSAKDLLARFSGELTRRMGPTA